MSIWGSVLQNLEPETLNLKPRTKGYKGNMGIWGPFCNTLNLNPRT
jgi:hypothetical protein